MAKLVQSLRSLFRIMFDGIIVCLLIMWYLISGFMFGNASSNKFLTSLLAKNKPTQQSNTKLDPNSPNTKSKDRFSLQVIDYVVNGMSPFIGLARIRANKKSQKNQKNQKNRRHKQHEIYTGDVEEDNHKNDISSENESSGLKSQFTSPISSNVTTPDLTPIQTPLPSYTPFEETQFKLEPSQPQPPYQEKEVLEEKDDSFKNIISNNENIKLSSSQITQEKELDQKIIQITSNQHHRSSEQIKHQKQSTTEKKTIKSISTQETSISRTPSPIEASSISNKGTQRRRSRSRRGNKKKK